jgi:hypothetical protein
MRACIEVEANCKAILFENGYSHAGDWSMRDYKKLNATHRLSSYEVRAPLWHGNRNTRAPFLAWASGGTLDWYNAYNAAKHDRYNEFQKANLNSLLDSLCGLVALLSSQFCREDFSPGPDLLALSGPDDGLETAIGGYFQVKFPTDWPANERYDFDWQKLESQADPFKNLTF